MKITMSLVEKVAGKIETSDFVSTEKSMHEVKSTAGKQAWGKCVQSVTVTDENGKIHFQIVKDENGKVVKRVYEEG